MKMKISGTFSTILSLIFLISPLFADGTGSSAGQTLNRTPSARPAALGDAFAAVPDDVSAFHYNPALLSTLKKSHASFLYQKGMADDAYGNLLLGLPLSSAGLGLQVGYYDAGKLDMEDGSQRNLMKDLTAALGYSEKLGPLHLGASLKYISSNLAETSKASAFAGDLGLAFPLASRFTLGASVQNIGTALKYEDKSESLDRTARLGFSWLALQSKVNLSLLGDLPYHLVDKNLEPGAGVEVGMGPLALRAGYKKGDLAKFTFGAGFNLSGLSLDYAYGLADTVDATHLASVSLRFGGNNEKTDMVKASPSIYQTTTKVEPQTPKQTQVSFSKTGERKTLDNLDEGKAPSSQNKSSSQQKAVRP